MQTKILPNFLKSLIPTFLLLLSAACESNEACATCHKCGENLQYGSVASLPAVSDKVETKLDTMVTVDIAFVENKIKIEEKYGQQWDFCRCVLANDSLDRAIKNNAELDEAFMKYFEEVDQKCKAFLVMSPNQTPDERDNHEVKIKKCLKVGRRK